MVDEISERIDKWLPAGVDDVNEIEMAIDDTGWQNGWDAGTTEAVAQTVAAGRDTDTEEFAKAKREQTVLAGQQDSRTAMVQTADTKEFLGKPENIVSVWEDQHGNIMAQGPGGNENRGKLVRKEDRDL